MPVPQEMSMSGNRTRGYHGEAEEDEDEDSLLVSLLLCHLKNLCVLRLDPFLFTPARQHRPSSGSSTSSKDARTHICYGCRARGAALEGGGEARSFEGEDGGCLSRGGRWNRPGRRSRWE